MSYLEKILEALIKSEGLPTPEREFRFSEARKWRADFSYPDQKILIEVEGGLFNNGRHVRPSGYILDVEKYNEAALLGYTVIRICKKHIDDGKAVEWIKRGLDFANRKRGMEES